MQKLKNIISSYLIFSVLFIFSACTEDPEEPKEAPSFPNKVNIDITKPGEYAEFSFDANYSWNLSSSKIWCKFVQNEDTLSTLSGLAGKHTVKVVLNGNAWEFEGAEAELSMRMLNQTKVVATLGREAKEYLIEAYGDSVQMVYDSENPITFIWNSFGTGLLRSTFNIKANFDWQIVSYPDWVLFTYEDRLTGETNELIANTCRYSTDAPIRSEVWGEFVISDKEGNKRATLPVKYEGMRADVLMFEVPGRSRYNFVLDVEGENYWEKRTDGSAPETTPAPLTFDIIANEEEKLNFGYFEDGDEGLTLIEESDRWYSATYPTAANDWKVEITVQPNEKSAERKGRIVVLPDVVFNSEEIQGNFENILQLLSYSGKWVVKNEYSKYIAIAFAQEYIEELGFRLTDANGIAYPAPLFRDAPEALYGTKNVFLCMIEGSAMPDQLTIEPLGYGSGMPDIDPKFGGKNTILNWPGVERSFNSLNQLVFKNIKASATDDPIIITYKKSGQIYATIIIMKI